MRNLSPCIMMATNIQGFTTSILNYSQVWGSQTSNFNKIWKTQGLSSGGLQPCLIVLYTISKNYGVLRVSDFRNYHIFRSYMVMQKETEKNNKEVLYRICTRSTTLQVAWRSAASDGNPRRLAGRSPLARLCWTDGAGRRREGDYRRGGSKAGDKLVTGPLKPSIQSIPKGHGKGAREGRQRGRESSEAHRAQFNLLWSSGRAGEGEGEGAESGSRK
jgi:hypothetical protein